MENLYDKKIEGLISAALADGVLTEKEKQILFKKAQAEGIDLDEFEMVLDARLVELKKAEKAKTTTSAPKSDKYGDVRKCPACGAMIPSLSGVCPECGHEISGITANLSSQKLAEQLKNEDDDKKRRIIIETFPIPNTKADLFEFLTALEPRINYENKGGLIDLDIVSAYQKKYTECINKVKISFKNDVDLQPFIESFEDKNKAWNKSKSEFIKRIKQKNNIMRFKKYIKKIIPIVLPILIIILIVNKCASDKQKVSDTKDRIVNLMQTKKPNSINEAMNELQELEEDDVLELVNKLIQQDNLDASVYEAAINALPKYDERDDYEEYKENCTKVINIINKLIQKDNLDASVYIAIINILPEYKGADGITGIITELIQKDDLDSVAYQKLISVLPKMVKCFHTEDIVTQLIKKNKLDDAIQVHRINGGGSSSTLYNALLEAERMDEALKYLGKIENDYCDAEKYMKYMNDVVMRYCKHKKKREARKFVNTHLNWFVSNIDNHVVTAVLFKKAAQEENAERKRKWGSASVKKQLMDVINKY